MHSDSRDGRSPRRRATLAALVAALMLLVALQIREPAAISESKTGPRFQPVRVIPAQPAIRKAPFIPASKVRGQVSDGELVLGVVINGKARAYPINMLSGPSREIINDTLGGKAIAATW